MATDFYQRQDAARRNTVWLVVLFVIAVVVIVGLSSLLAMWAAELILDRTSPGSRGAMPTTEGPEPYAFGIGAGLMSLMLVLGGSLFKIFELRHGGGKSVAESVGGNRLYANNDIAEYRKLLNVVEEMAIASGTSVPPVYLIDDNAINAFAAGYAPGDAVIGVTRGACQQLSRSELQGVIAHEFSHILNGDMRSNIRLIGILHGILLLSLIGRMLLNSLRFGSLGRRRSSGNRDGDGGKALLVILLAGVALLLLGLVGSWIGGMIKAAVSRQREYLADASAVQFTRDPSGIAGALQQIGAGRSRSRLSHPNASVASHMYFAKGVFEGISGLMATHPPLDKRIRAIDPTWDGTFPTARTAAETDGGLLASSGEALEAAAGFQASAMAPPQHSEDLSPELLTDAAFNVGHPGQAQAAYAAALLAELPATVLDSAREAATARGVVIALLLHRDSELRELQLQEVRSALGDFCASTSQRIWQQLDNGPQEYRLPLLDLTLPALASMSSDQYAQFAKTINRLSSADQRISLFEWTLAHVLMRRLAPQFESVRFPLTRYYALARLGEPVSILLSTVARVGHSGDQVRAAFEVGQRFLPGVNAQLLPPERCSLESLSKALDTLATTSVPKRGELVNACAKTICSDRTVTVAEGELLRGIADLLDCPVPPFVAATALRSRDEAVTATESS